MSDEAYHRFAHEAMATTFEVVVAGHEREYARQASAAVFREIDRIERLLTRFDSGSDVGQINLLKPGESVRVAIETLECLEVAAWAHGVSGGLFDPAVGSGFQWLVIDRASFSIGWTGEGKGRLDLGGVGKGYAIDKAAGMLEEWGVAEALVNGGTSTVLAIGRAWPLGIGGLWGEKIGFCKIDLKDKALSGSGTEVKGAHIIDPATGRPTERHLAAWAIHPCAAVSDALSTAFMVMPTEEIERLCKGTPEMAAVVVAPDGNLVRFGV